MRRPQTATFRFAKLPRYPERPGFSLRLSLKVRLEARLSASWRPQGVAYTPPLGFTKAPRYPKCPTFRLLLTNSLNPAYSVKTRTQLDALLHGGTPLHICGFKGLVMHRFFLWLWTLVASLPQRFFVAMRSLAALGLRGCLLLAFVPMGCASTLEHPPLKQQSSSATGPQLPKKTVARLQECVDEYADQLEGHSYRMRANVKIGEELIIEEVRIADLVHPDLDACTRVALRAMAAPESMLQLGVDEWFARANEQTPDARAMMGNPAVWYITIKLVEIAIQAGAVTIAFAVAVELTNEAVKALKRRRPRKKTCTEHLQDCLDTATNDWEGNNWNTRRCKTCFDLCRDGNWPAFIYLDGPASCAYKGWDQQ
jgi:hypothetical protein